MTMFIISLGALILFCGLLIIIFPEIIFGFLRRNVDKLALHILAVAVRLVFGILLIFQSSESSFPLAVELIGWLAVVAALSLVVMGRQNFLRLMTWALKLLKPYGRFGGVIAAAFGGFIIYAFI